MSDLTGFGSINDMIFDDGQEEVSGLRVVYILQVGVDPDGMNIYNMLLSTETEETWAESWSDKPASNNSRALMTLPGDQYEYIKGFKTRMKLDLAQDNMCFSMQDVKDDCLALAFENIDGYEEYPSPIRIVIHYGEGIESVESQLLERGIETFYVKKSNVEEEDE